MDQIELQKLVQDISSSQKEAKEAGKKFYDSQINYKRELLTIFEKMSLFSAGIISLSITFVSGLVPTYKNLMLTQLFTLPIYIYLYISWTSLTLNLIIGLFLRWADALYLFFNQQKEYHKKNKKFQEVKLSFDNNYPNIIFSEDTNKDQEIQTGIKNIETLKDTLIPAVEKKENLYYLISKGLQSGSVITFILGISLLLLFIIKITNAVIYK